MAALARNRFQQKLSGLGGLGPPNDQSGRLRGLPHDKQKNKKQFNISLVHWLVVMFLDCLIVYYIHVIQINYPNPLDHVSGSTKGQFIEASARSYLEGITRIGPRPVGGGANEEVTVEYILKAISEIKQKANVVHDIEVDSQRSSGTFNINFLGGFASVYENVNNIIVKFRPRGGASDSLLINCHYDTVINSTGASDDAVSCSLMLEVLRVLASEERSYSHEIIFMFNGAEESILQASHGFITQHPWAKNIRAFVNLEAGGAGGREILFQAGPENPWMIQLYSDNVPHPFASVVGQELFESGIIPSDTDYRIFRDHGGLPGLDIAYISNGYVYHTPNDVPEMIPPGCMQRGGENLLAIVRSFANSPLLSDPGQYKHGKLVFFDFLGMKMVIYPQNVGTIINLIIVAAVLVGIGKKVTGPQTGSMRQNYMRHLMTAIGILLISWLLTILVAALLGFLTDLIGQPMSWFTNSWLLIGLYAAPSGLFMLLVNEAAKYIIFDGFPMWEVESLFFEANMAVFSVLLAVLTLKGISSAVILLLFVLFPLLIRDRMSQIFNINGKNSPQKFFLLHLASTIIPVTMFLYTVFMALSLFIPLMGRIGPGSIPDIFIGVIVAVTVVFTMSYNIGLVYVSSSTRPLQILLVWLWLIAIIMATVTPIGFPYQANSAAPTKQRHIVHHIERTFHDHTGYVYKHDSGLLHFPLDRNSITVLKPQMPILQEATLTDCRGPYCGWPYYFPMLTILHEVYYIPSSAPQLTPRAHLKRVNTTELSQNIQRWHFQVTGPNHVNVFLSPLRGVKLVNWSVGDGEIYPTNVPPGAHQPQYFIYYSYGTKPDKPWQFWIDLQVDDLAEPSHGLLEIALSAHYITIDGTNIATPELDAYLGSFPDWTTVSGWSATYECWNF